MENCKDCPYIEALGDRVTKIENKIDDMEEKLNIATTENEKTKVYFDKIVSKIDDLKELFCTKMFSFESRLEKVEKALEEKNKVYEEKNKELEEINNEAIKQNNTFLWRFYERNEKLTNGIIIVLSILAGLRLLGIDIVKLIMG